MMDGYVFAYLLMYLRTYGLHGDPKNPEKFWPPETVAKPYRFDALVIIFTIFVIRWFFGSPGGGP